MNKNVSIKLSAVLAAVLVGVAGCSQSEDQQENTSGSSTSSSAQEPDNEETQTARNENDFKTEQGYSLYNASSGVYCHIVDDRDSPLKCDTNGEKMLFGARTDARPVSGFVYNENEGFSIRHDDWRTGLNNDNVTELTPGDYVTLGGFTFHENNVGDFAILKGSDMVTVFENTVETLRDVNP